MLASSSPRRHELFKKISLKFVIAEPLSSEDSSESDPKKIVLDNALMKVYSLVDIYSDSIIIGADTIIFQNGHVLGKPSNKKEAEYMLKLLSGRNHQVYTGVVVFNSVTSKVVKGFEKTNIRFKKLSNETIENYIESDEPFGKAGAYAIQEKGVDFVDKIEGSWSNVVGLPIKLTKRLIKKALDAC